MSEQLYDAKAERAAIEYIHGQQVRLHGEGKAMKTDIEYAALVMGERVIHDCNDRGARITGQEDEWNSLHDDGDSRRLEIACLNWIGRVIECPKSVTLAYAEFTGFICGAIGIQPEQYRAAVFTLAVAIGKVMEGNDNAGCSQSEESNK
jgi:hypothetical protein